MGDLSRLNEDLSHLSTLDGLMYGREAYHNPWILSDVDPIFTGTDRVYSNRKQVVEAMFDYIAPQLEAGMPLHRITRHMLGLFHAQPGGRIWRQILSTEGCKSGAGIEVLQKALAMVDHHAAEAA